MRTLFCLLLPLLLCGCLERQLSGNTVDVSASIARVQYGQTLANLGRLAREPSTLPSVAFLIGGTVQVTNSLTPSVTFPLSSMFSRAAATAVTSTTTTAAAGASIGGAVTWQENFNVVPLLDPFTLRNLSILYRTVLGDGLAGLLLYQVPRVYDRDDRLVPDPYYLQSRPCVFCLAEGSAPPKTSTDLTKRVYSGLKPAADKDILVNDALAYQWLFYKARNGAWRPGPPPGDAAGLDYLGTSDGTEFYVLRSVPKGEGLVDGEGLYRDFILMTLPLSPAPPRFASVSRPPDTGRQNGRGKTGTPQAEAQPRRDDPAAALNNFSEGFRLPNLSFLPSPGIQVQPGAQ